MVRGGLQAGFFFRGSAWDFLGSGRSEVDFAVGPKTRSKIKSSGKDRRIEVCSGNAAHTVGHEHHTHAVPKRNFEQARIQGSYGGDHKGTHPTQKKCVGFYTATHRVNAKSEV